MDVCARLRDLVWFPRQTRSFTHASPAVLIRRSSGNQADASQEAFLSSTRPPRTSACADCVDLVAFGSRGFAPLFRGQVMLSDCFVRIRRSPLLATLAWPAF